VAKRERLIADKKRYEQVIATWEKNGAYVFPSSSKRVEKLKARLEALKSRIEAAQREVTKYYNRMYPSSGYFRDSYNGSSVLWRLGMSWWQDVPDGVLTASQLEELVRKVQVAKLKPITAAELEEGGCKVDDKENSPEIWNKYFRNKKRRLVRFLKRAAAHAALGHEVYFSL